jgi:hypothetical protein
MGSLRFRRNFRFRSGLPQSILPRTMPWYRRFYSPGELPFLTASTYRRTPLFRADRFRRCFVQRLEEVRQPPVFRVLQNAVRLAASFHRARRVALPLVAAPLLPLQRFLGEEVPGEAGLPAQQPGGTGVGDLARRLAVVKLEVLLPGGRLHSSYGPAALSPKPRSPFGIADSPYQESAPATGKVS